jgi:type IV pilus assembly protein PilC
MFASVILAYLSNGEPIEPPNTTLAVLAYVGIWLVAVYVVASIAWSILGRPLQRRQRARFFLDLIETGLADGQSPENTVVAIAKSRDMTLGHSFHLLSAHLETGLRFTEALEKVPRFLPPQLIAMFAVGEQIGDIRKVLPACRKALSDGSSRTTSAVNYLVIVLLMLNPVCGLVWPFLTIVIVPKFQEIFSDLLEGRSLPPLLLFLIANARLVTVIQLSLMVVSFVALLAYACGPRGIPWLRPLVDAINYRLPWRRKRLERDFTAMLALLLDAGVPEHEAVTLAAHSTDNGVFVRRGAEVAQRLRNGTGFLEALRGIDDTGELQWRMANAIHGHGGFMKALTGWHEALEAKAYQLEQTASQSITTGLVILNGCIVGLIAVGMFQALTWTVWGLTLW